MAFPRPARMGGGLGAMKRLATRFEIFTGPGGTVVLLESGVLIRKTRLEIAGMALPYPGERVCGDDWCFDQQADRTIAVIADGLGHGLEAADAAKEAIAVVSRARITGARRHFALHA